MKKGISLIVLSITILVMAILAATAIISLEDSGIIGRSKNVVGKHNKDEEYTMLQTIKNGILTDNLGTITVEEYITELKNKALIDDEISISKFENVVVKTKSGTIVYIKDDGNGSIKISFEEILSQPLKAMKELITSAADYGKNVNYVSDNGINDWQLFYHTEDKVYLIATQSLSYDIAKELTIPGAMVEASTITLTDSTMVVGNIYWEDNTKVPANAATISNASIWMANWSDYGKYPNGICATYFLDENIWSRFKNSSESYSKYVIGAIGTPTAEMFVASWNAKRLAETNTDKINLQLKSESVGYNINSGVYVQLAKDPLYMWCENSNSSIRLASPSKGSTSSLMAVLNVGITTATCSSKVLRDTSGSMFKRGYTGNDKCRRKFCNIVKRNEFNCEFIPFIFVLPLSLCFKVCECKCGADIGVLFSWNNNREIFTSFDVYSKLLLFEITVTYEFLLSIRFGELEIAVYFKI